MRPTTSTAVARIAPSEDAPRRATAKPRRHDVTVAVVTVLHPSTAARLETAQALGRSLRCAYRNGRLQVWTEESQ
jgi:hypothetical protein